MSAARDTFFAVTCTLDSADGQVRPCSSKCVYSYKAATLVVRLRTRHITKLHIR